jgi:integrase
MSVRKRIWKTRTGETKEAWIVDYVDQQGGRHIETFERKKDADARHATVKINVSKGIHVAASKSITVAEASKQWADVAEAEGLQRATVRTYRQHVDLHIVPLLGRTKLSDITVPVVAQFRQTLRARGGSAAMIRKVMVSLGSIIAQAQQTGKVAHNAVRELHSKRRRGKQERGERKAKLRVGVDIPTREEIGSMLGHAPERWRPLLLVAAFTGLRAGELRGLRWADVDVKESELHVRQRADRWGDMNLPKSEAGERTVPFGKIVANTLRELRLRSSYSADSDLVFCTSKGTVIEHSNLLKLSLHKAQELAGMVDTKGEPKYSGLHSLRHFYASWCINRQKDGGLGLPPKNVQERLGHANISMTLDTYGHLFRADDAKELDAAEMALISGSATRTRQGA